MERGRGGGGDRDRERNDRYIKGKQVNIERGEYERMKKKKQE